MLLDLIENRVACMQVIDREDHRQLAILTQARREILSMSATVKREERGKARSAAPLAAAPAQANAAAMAAPVVGVIPSVVPVPTVAPVLETVAAA
ncbi:MAG: hypothetical protein FJX57_10025 [Alphaproteobacteria bacterium]|nr:hypothetical protein [Alphaproteobacteria bacterium]